MTATAYLPAMRLENRPIPDCPICGFVATERQTKYGPRSECCGLWSWNRMPLADAATHEQRKHLGPLFGSLAKALGQQAFFLEMRNRTGVRSTTDMTIALMNEATARKMRAAAEDLLMDMIAGKVVAK